ncbi:MAG: hypothetical protein K2M55_08860 [Muribaculaceae bacterium]|nr:hypothetical protein [Muribaculaceae bacterium]
MRHELNPAFASEYNYVSFPALGDLNIGAMSNVGVNTFLYKMPGGQLTTFMNKSVSADEFLGKLSNHNKVTFNTDVTILAAGFKAFKGYNTINIGVRADAGVTMPKGLFEFMKLGQTGPDTEYNFKDLTVKANAMAEVALGHSHTINERLDVGAKVKVLLGVGNVHGKITDMRVRMSDTQWAITANGEMNIAAGNGLEFPTKQESGKEYDDPSEATEVDWDNINYDSFGLGGFGLGFDLGATYKLLPELTLSLAVRDLGFMNWNHNYKAATPGKEWSFGGFSEIALDSDQPNYEDNKIGQQFDDLWDDMQDMVNFHREDVRGSRLTALSATLHIGAEYVMPFYKGLTGGFLFTHQFNGPFSWTEGRFSANVKPAKWFDATINYGASTFGSSLGWMLNFHPRGFNFFVGTDHQFFKVTPQFIPVGHASAALNMGINFTFGS